MPRDGSTAATHALASAQEARGTVVDDVPVAADSHAREAPAHRASDARAEFALPLAEARERVQAALSKQRQREAKLFARPDRAARERFDLGFVSTFEVETSADPLFARGLFDEPLNRDDLYLHNFDAPIALSRVYRDGRGALAFAAAFHVHFESLDAGHCALTVRALHPTVLTGKKFGFGPCGPGLGWQSTAVEPSGVEEGLLLRYLASALGRDDLPRLVTPPPIDVRAR